MERARQVQGLARRRVRRARPSEPRAGTVTPLSVRTLTGGDAGIGRDVRPSYVQVGAGARMYGFTTRGGPALPSIRTLDNMDTWSTALYAAQLTITPGRTSATAARTRASSVMSRSARVIATTSQPSASTRATVRPSCPPAPVISALTGRVPSPWRGSRDRSAALDGLALVVGLLALRDAHRQLHQSLPEVHPDRHQGEPALHHLADQLADLPLVQQQLAPP